MMMMLTLNMFFLFMNHPMSMGLLLIMQTLAVGVMTGMILKTFWLSYILLISMLSGMLVLFIYMSSMASNEKFKISVKMFVMMIMLILANVMFHLILNKMSLKNNLFSAEMMMMKTPEMLFFTKMFKAENMTITIMMVMYLLMTMIVSTFLVNISEGPMRSKM